jgi:hypothetical protein
MTTSAAATHAIPPAMITHSIAVISQQHPDITVHHARTPDGLISVTFNGIHMTIYSAQGLLEAFAVASGQMIHVPGEIPSIPKDPQEPDARVVLSLEWTRRPAYAVVAQSALNKVKTARIHWIDRCTPAPSPAIRS